MELSPVLHKYFVRFMYIVLLYIAGEKEAKAMARQLADRMRVVFKEEF